MSNKRGPSRTITLSDIRGAMRGLEDAGELPSTPPEITNALDKETSDKTVRKRLEQLKKQGEAEKHDAGRANVWELTSEGMEADADLANQIAGLLQSAEPQDIPQDQATWVIDSLSPDQISKEKTAEIIQDADPELISDQKAIEIIRRLDASDIPKSKIFEAFESEKISVEEIPEEYAESVLTERYDYNISYWADQYRFGRAILASAGLSSALGFGMFLFQFQIGPLSLPSFGGVALPAFSLNSQVIGALLILVGLLLSAFGSLFGVVGFLGMRYSTIDDPRPWKEYILANLQIRN